MTDCPSCSARVRLGQEECENCGFPMDAARPGSNRATRLEEPVPDPFWARGPSPPSGAPVPGKGLYRPSSGRKTQIEPADPFAASTQPRGTAAMPVDPRDPFERALSGAGHSPAAPRRRRTVIGAAASGETSADAPSGGPADPFAAALVSADVAWPAMERPLAGVLITFSAAPNGRLMPLTLGRTIIGRDPGPAGPDTLLIRDDSISARHCVIVARDAGVMMKDEMSSNGTLLRRAGSDSFEDILAETVQLGDGDQIKLGDTLLLLRLLDRTSIAGIWGAS